MKRIRFVPSPNISPEIVPPPEPAKNFIPQWHKEGELFLSEDLQNPAKPGDKNRKPGMKSCIPFLDAMISGYMITTWYDAEITENTEDSIKIKYTYTDSSGEKLEIPKELTISMFNVREGAIGHTIPRPVGHAKHHLVLEGKWGIRMPTGWSVFVTHPYNRYDLPFTTLSGFMDSDGFWSAGNIPFFIREGWTGVIPRGTPMAQIIPVKRSSWAGYISPLSMKHSEKIGERARSVEHGYYRDKIWVKKKYE